MEDILEVMISWFLFWSGLGCNRPLLMGGFTLCMCVIFYTAGHKMCPIFACWVQFTSLRSLYFAKEVSKVG